MPLATWRITLAFAAALIPFSAGAQVLLSSPPERARLASVLHAAATCPAATGRNFARQDLTNHNFHAEPPGSLRGANFEGAILKGAVFEGQDLTGASFKGADLGPSANGTATFAKTKLDHVCFIDATLNATDFTFATFTCSDFTGTSLMQANFGPGQTMVAGNNCRTNFTDATMDVNAIDPSNWGKSDFSYTHFQNVSPSTFTLAGRDITNARLAGANFSNIDMTGANLTGVDFKGAKLLNAKMVNAALNGADLTGADLSVANMTCARFYGKNSDDRDNPNGKICTATPLSSKPDVAAKLIQATMPVVDLTNATLNSAVLTGANLSGSTLRGTSFIGSWLEPAGAIGASSVLGADLTGADFRKAHINQVHFNNVLLTSAKFDGTTLNGTDFSGSIMPLATFTDSILQNVNFHSTILQGASFKTATMQTTPNSQGTGVIFTCAHLGGANFADAKIQNADFQSAIMPPADQCCPQQGNTYWCGTINAVQKTYGGVTYPIMQSKVTCPNGKVDACKGSQWTIPGWQTRLCNSDQVVETVWRKPDCGSSPGDYVQFKDKNLESCILDSLPGNPSGVSVATAAQMTHVSCAGRKIADIGGLDKFTSLISLDLTGNQLTQFALPVKTLQNLKIGSNKLTSLDLSWTKVIRLDASNNQLSSIAGLGNIFFLILDVSHNKLTAFDLPVQDPLVYADLSYNSLTNVLNTSNPDLRRLNGLAYLDLSHNSLKTIGPANAVAYSSRTQTGSMESLYLECNVPFDCAGLNLDASYPAYKSSGCAEFNSQSKQWVQRPHPICPNGQ